MQCWSMVSSLKCLATGAYKQMANCVLERFPQPALAPELDYIVHDVADSPRYTSLQGEHYIKIYQAMCLPLHKSRFNRNHACRSESKNRFGCGSMRPRCSRPAVMRTQTLLLALPPVNLSFEAKPLWSLWWFRLLGVWGPSHSREDTNENHQFGEVNNNY